jgi:ectoine hydroxylase-related dioxygenase (phytanoyl-CoA dioxygenase family)
VLTFLSAWKLVETYLNKNEALLSRETAIAYGARNLLRVWPQIIDVVRQDELRKLIVEVLGDRAGIVKALFFDKAPGQSWALPWHKDNMIVVNEHAGQSVLTNPSFASGMPQVKATKEVLENMLTVRLHLHPMTDHKGSLKVFPGSHRFYSMSEDGEIDPVILNCNAGDVLLMRPLLTHSRRKSKPGAGNRRILHLECAARPELPDGYRWHDYIEI